MPTQLSGNETRAESFAIGLLQSATTVASIALGLLTFLAESKVARVVPLLVFAAGSASLYAGMLAIWELLASHRRSLVEIFRDTSSIGILFKALVFLAVAYVLVEFPEIGDVIASIFGRPAPAPSPGP